MYKEKPVIKVDHGTIYFGKRFKGYKWNDPRVSKEWLEYVISDECLTTEENKQKARDELKNRSCPDNQMEWGFDK
jgi:hypothetical protein